MSKCDTIGCTGHLAKFPDCVTEALWQIGMEGFADETTGSTEAHGHFMLILREADEVVTLDEGTPDTHDVTIPAGAHIVSCYDSGAVYSETFDSEAHARKAFDAHDTDYAAWSDVNEG